MADPKDIQDAIRATLKGKNKNVIDLQDNEGRLYRSVGSQEIYKVRVNKGSSFKDPWWETGLNQTFYHLRVRHMEQMPSEYLRSYGRWDSEEGSLIRQMIAGKKPKKSDGTEWSEDPAIVANLPNLNNFVKYGKILTALAKAYAPEIAYTTIAAAVELVGYMLRAEGDLIMYTQVDIPNMLPGHLLMVLFSMGGSNR